MAQVSRIKAKEQKHVPVSKYRIMVAYRKHGGKVRFSNFASRLKIIVLVLYESEAWCLTQRQSEGFWGRRNDDYNLLSWILTTETPVSL
jgi:hypothetical protein